MTFEKKRGTLRSTMTHHRTRSVVSIDRMDAVHNVRFTYRAATVALFHLIRKFRFAKALLRPPTAHTFHSRMTKQNLFLFLALTCEWSKYNDVLESGTSRT